MEVGIEVPDLGTPENPNIKNIKAYAKKLRAAGSTNAADYYEAMISYHKAKDSDEPLPHPGQKVGL